MGKVFVVLEDYDNGMEYEDARFYSGVFRGVFSTMKEARGCIEGYVLADYYEAVDRCEMEMMINEDCFYNRDDIFRFNIEEDEDDRITINSDVYHNGCMGMTKYRIVEKDI